jgi:hypothetical protein
MSANGTYQSATVYIGFLYTSSNAGVTWTQRDSSRNWKGVSLSDNGSNQTAAGWATNIYTASSYGASWISRDSARVWFDTHVSPSGIHQVAAEAGGRIYTSSDYGASWSVKGFVSGWGAVALSADGSTILGAGGEYYDRGMPIAASWNSGTTWVNVTDDILINDLSISNDGLRATAVGDDYAIFITHDGGQFWRPITIS